MNAEIYTTIMNNVKTPMIWKNIIVRMTVEETYSDETEDIIGTEYTGTCKANLKGTDVFGHGEITSTIDSKFLGYNGTNSANVTTGEIIVIKDTFNGMKRTINVLMNWYPNVKKFECRITVFMYK